MSASTLVRLLICVHVGGGGGSRAGDVWWGEQGVVVEVAYGLS